MSTLTKKEFLKLIQHVPDDTNFYLHCSYNTFEIGRVINWGDKVTLHAGEADNSSVPVIPDDECA